jgi:hypothetical protein
MESYKKRVIEEQEELSEKIGRLAAFLMSEESQKIDKTQELLLTMQLQIMTFYDKILKERIKLF